MALNSVDLSIRWIKRIGIFMLGLSVNKAIVVWYDFSVYPNLIANYGLVRGWLYAAAGSVVLCLGTLWFYNVTKQDWLLLESIKHVRDGQARGRIRRFFRNLFQKSDVLAFVVLCMAKDAFIATVYMRKGAENYAMSARDWKVFWASVLISEVWWGLAVFGVITAFKHWLIPIIPLPLLEWMTLVINTAEEFNLLLASLIPPVLTGWLGF